MISLAQGSFVETQLVYFPGQQGFRNSTATQHGAPIYKYYKHLMYATALFQEQASNSTQRHQSLLAPATRDLNQLHQTIQSRLMHLFPNGRLSTRLIRWCALSCESRSNFKLALVPTNLLAREVQRIKRPALSFPATSSVSHITDLSPCPSAPQICKS